MSPPGDEPQRAVRGVSYLPRGMSVPRPLPGMGPRRIAVGLVLVGLLSGGCAGQTAQSQGARGYNQRNDLPPRDIGPAADTGPAARDMPGKGRGTDIPRGK